MTSRQSLATSGPLRDWLRSDPAWQAQPWHWRARQAWLAALGSFNARLSQAVEPSGGTPSALQDPVLIVGPWRSGTTVMHELLVAATELPTPRTWQCMNPCAFRLSHAHGRGPAIARPMDGLEIGPESPQEDEFALLALGVDSAYRAFWMPHRLDELHHTLDPAHWSGRPDWLVPWEGFLRGVLATDPHAGAARPLVLKSPNHTYRLASILQRFPRARLVWMARDAGQVFMSNRKMWTTMFGTHGITAARPGALNAFLGKALASAADIVAWCAANLPADQWIAVPHDRLLEQPGDVVRAALDRLGLPRTPAEDSALRAALARTGRGRVEHHAADWPPATEPAVRALDAAQTAALSRFGV